MTCCPVKTTAPTTTKRDVACILPVKCSTHDCPPTMHIPGSVRGPLEQAGTGPGGEDRGSLGVWRYLMSAPCPRSLWENPVSCISSSCIRKPGPDHPAVWFGGGCIQAPRAQGPALLGAPRTSSLATTGHGEQTRPRVGPEQVGAFLWTDGKERSCTYQGDRNANGSPVRG